MYWVSHQLEHGLSVAAVKISMAFTSMRLQRLVALAMELYAKNGKGRQGIVGRERGSAGLRSHLQELCMGSHISK